MTLIKAEEVKNMEIRKSRRKKQKGRKSARNVGVGGKKRFFLQHFRHRHIWAWVRLAKRTVFYRTHSMSVVLHLLPFIVRLGHRNMKALNPLLSMTTIKIWISFHFFKKTYLSWALKRYDWSAVNIWNARGMSRPLRGALIDWICFTGRDWISWNLHEKITLKKSNQSIPTILSFL